MKRSVAGLVLLAACATAPDEARVRAACERVSEVRRMPFKDEAVADDAYSALLDVGEPVVPCLIDQIADRTPTPDPRKAPTQGAVAVGDVAFFVLLRITGAPIEDLLPDAALSRWDDLGMGAYFDYVSDPANRSALQSHVRDRWERTRAAPAP